jgi:large subunit ribosomal protein L23
MRHILKKPILSEKSMALSEKRQYVFEVVPSANKIEIRKAIEERYRVAVDQVRTITVRPKSKMQMTRRGVTAGRTATRKKAIVTLRHGQSIDIIGDLPNE